MKQSHRVCLLIPLIPEGKNYQEIVEFHSATEYLGRTVKHWLELKNDTLSQI